jgi:hypothetical protein
MTPALFGLFSHIICSVRGSMTMGDQVQIAGRPHFRLLLCGPENTASTPGTAVNSVDELLSSSILTRCACFENRLVYIIISIVPYDKCWSSEPSLQQYVPVDVQVVVKTSPSCSLIHINIDCTIRYK